MRTDERTNLSRVVLDVALVLLIALPIVVGCMAPREETPEQETPEVRIPAPAYKPSPEELRCELLANGALEYFKSVLENDPDRTWSDDNATNTVDDNVTK